MTPLTQASDHAAKMRTILHNIISKTEVVKKEGFNPYFKSHYATLNSVLEMLEPILKENGASLTQQLTWDEGAQFLVTFLLHPEHGVLEIARVKMLELGVGNPPTTSQMLGGAITYFRRYSLVTAFSLQMEDDDGTAASSPSASSSSRGGGLDLTAEALKKMRSSTDRQAAELAYRDALKHASPSDKPSIIAEWQKVVAERWAS